MDVADISDVDGQEIAATEGGVDSQREEGEIPGLVPKPVLDLVQVLAEDNRISRVMVLLRCHQESFEVVAIDLIFVRNPSEVHSCLVHQVLVC